MGNFQDTAAENPIRGIVMAKFPSISAFAKAMDWDRKKASRIVNLKQKPNANDMEQMAKRLDVKDVYAFVHIFLPTLSTKWNPDDHIDKIEVKNMFGH